MKKTLLLSALTAVLAFPAGAALQVGSSAPLFTTEASIGGKVFAFSMAEALKKGPVVLYFYPAAFTPGCTVEAHDFADAVEKYHALGATIIGISHDDIEKLNKFSVSECRSKFAVGADPKQSIMKSYDSVMRMMSDYASRTSYVIAPSGEIIYTYSDLSPSQHVSNTLDALQKWVAAHKAK